MIETRIPPQSIVKRVLIQFDKHSKRLFGIQLFDREGTLLLSAGLNRPAFDYAGKHEIILEEEERLIGARSVMENPDMST